MPSKKKSEKANPESKGKKATDGKKDKAAKPRKDNSRATTARLPMVARGMRIGLLGGSFNPAHEGHLRISLIALKRLGLDQVWWLVSRTNPLKDASDLPSRKKRVAAAKELAKHPRIVVTGFAGARRSVYTIDVLAELKQRFPTTHFVWLMGADNLAGFHRWRAWQQLFELAPIAVLDRPGFRHKAMASKAAYRYARNRVDESDAGALPLLEPPAWAILSHPLSRLSSTALRGKGANAGKKPRPGRNKH
ncbi:MAG: nicotinate-nucleotide adenylyltransferase [Methyloceanibacter sp.]|uniref:nicotinate-nucleotide adenylyltransferase n=1 Tax=Methyloceanibacter sp. TaxID=1965321 RepID=UPI003D9B20D6